MTALLVIIAVLMAVVVALLAAILAARIERVRTAPPAQRYFQAAAEYLEAEDARR